jgi:hypothetical protein
MPSVPPGKQPKFPYPPKGQSVPTSFPTPTIADVIISVVKDPRVPGYQAVPYGTPHPDTNKFPEHKLSVIKLSEDGLTAIWFYVSDRANEDAWNFTLKYALESKPHSIISRTYTLPRAEYVRPDNLTADPVAADHVLVHEEELAISDQPEMGTLYIRVLRIYKKFPGPLLTTDAENQRGYALIPDEFRQNDQIDETEQEVLTGTVPDNATGNILESTVKPIDTVEAKKTNKILVPGTPPTLTDKITNRFKQLATQIRRLITTGSSSAAPSATATVEVTDLGNGKSVEKVLTDPSLFTEPEYAVEIPDLIPLKFRGILPTRTQSARSAGTAAPPSLGTGELRRDVKQQDVFVERTEVVSRDLALLPKTLIDKELTREFGGTILDVTETLDDTVLSVDQGQMVTESTVTNLGNGLQLKSTKQAEDSEWPEIVGVETDPTYGIIIDIAKKVIPAGTLYPGETLSVVSPYIDINPLDKWRSIQIVSKVNPDSLPADLVWYGTHEVDLPPTLLGVSASWDRTGGTTQTADISRFGVATANVEISSGVLGSIEVLLRHNYRGPALAKFTRHFSIGPPPLIDLPSITKIIPVTGTASLIGQHVKFGQSRGTSFTPAGTNSTDSNDGQMRTESKTFGPFLSGSIVNGTSDFSDGTNSATAIAGPDVNGNTFTATLVLPGSTGTLKINIPVSNPLDIFPGDKFIVLVEPENWRFGVFVTHIVEITVP